MDMKVRPMSYNLPSHPCPSTRDSLALLSSFPQFLHQRLLKLLQLLGADAQQAAHVADENPRPGVILAWVGRGV